MDGISHFDAHFGTRSLFAFTGFRYKSTFSVGKFLTLGYRRYMGTFIQRLGPSQVPLLLGELCGTWWEDAERPALAGAQQTKDIYA